MLSTIVHIVPKRRLAVSSMEPWLELLCGALGLLVGFGLGVAEGPTVVALPLASMCGMAGVVLGESLGRALGRLLVRTP